MREFGFREKFVPKEVGECAGNPGEDEEKVCLESMDHFFSPVVVVRVGGGELEF